MRYRIEPQADHLRVVADGPFDTALGRRVVAEIFAASARAGLTRILVDARDLEPAIGVTERFEMGRALAEHRTGPTRIAVLVSPAHMVAKTLEDSARNRGVPVITTASESEAYGYLGLASPA